LELEKRINEIPIGSELGFTRPGPYIYEFLAEMKITYETVSMLIDTIDQATALLEDGKLLTAICLSNTFSQYIISDKLCPRYTVVKLPISHGFTTLKDSSHCKHIRFSRIFFHLGSFLLRNYKDFSARIFA